MNRILIATVLCSALACSSSEETKPGKTNEQNAKQNSQTQASAITEATSGMGQSAADKLYSAGTSSQNTVGTAAWKGELAPLNIGTLASPDEAGCKCDGKKCTFTDCTRGGGSASVKLNGTLDADGGVFKCDLTWVTDATGGGVGTKLSVHVKADMTTTATSIKGTLHTDGSSELKGIELPVGIPGGAGGGNTSWTNDATWDVTVANGQATAGSVDFNGTYKVGDTTYTGSGKTTFP